MVVRGEIHVPVALAWKRISPPYWIGEGVRSGPPWIT